MGIPCQFTKSSLLSGDRVAETSPAALRLDELALIISGKTSLNEVNTNPLKTAEFQHEGMWRGEGSGNLVVSVIINEFSSS